MAAGPVPGASPAFRLTDGSAAAFAFLQARVTRTHSAPFLASVYVKRDPAASAWVMLEVDSGADRTQVRFDPRTGDVSVNAPTGATVRGFGAEDAGGDWVRIWLSAVHPAGTRTYVNLSPARGANQWGQAASATGSALFFGPQLTEYPVLSAYLETTGTAVAGPAYVPAAAEVAAFAGAAAPGHFAVAGEAVTYSGPADDWGFRRFILHLAHLAKAAGGVDAFLIGTEMVGLTTATDAAGAYPFVDVLAQLAADVAGVLPEAALSYAADWSEYHSHRVGGEVFFHLDPLWASPHVDFVAIDNYFPLADWRDGVAHADYDVEAGHVSQYSLAYLKSNVEGGEYWDYFYASPEDRAAQVRTPIADLAHGETWVFRQKAVRDWHGHAHHNRPGGVRDASATAWVPGSKPVWFTELGAPAVDKAANQPNVFPSALSSEGAFPHFSAGTRDDFAARQYVRAALEWWAENGAGVVDPADVLVWSWDARPWPEFPGQAAIWADAADWSLGHWWNGRAGAAVVAEAARRRLSIHGFPLADADLAEAWGQVDGYATGEALGFRAWLQPLDWSCGWTRWRTAVGWCCGPASPPPRWRR